MQASISTTTIQCAAMEDSAVLNSDWLSQTGLLVQAWWFLQFIVVARVAGILLVVFNVAHKERHVS